MKWLSLLALALLLAGCGEAVGVRPPLITGSSGPAPAAGAELLALGRAHIWLGGIVGTLALLARFILPAGGPWLVLAEGAGAVLLAGIAYMWLGAHLWVAGLACLAVGGLLLWHWCPGLRRWLRARLATVPAHLRDDLTRLREIPHA